MKIPLHSYDLIRELATTCPEVIYDPAIGHDEQMLRFGERRLVKRLLWAIEREHEDQHVRSEHSEETED